MAEKKISDLTNKENINNDDELIFVDKATTSGTDAGVGGQTSKIKFSDLKTAVGTSGPQGSQGSQGSQGAKGFQGNNGNQGQKGFQGNNGNQGSQGRQGVRGHQGAQGKQGNTGVGQQGKQGNTGTGQQGKQGHQGKQGNTGVGQQGKQGATGTFGGGKVNQLVSGYLNVTDGSGPDLSTQETLIKPAVISVGNNNSSTSAKEHEGGQIDFKFPLNHLGPTSSHRHHYIDTYVDTNRIYNPLTWPDSHPLAWSNAIHGEAFIRFGFESRHEYIKSSDQSRVVSATGAPNGTSNVGTVFAGIASKSFFNGHLRVCDGANNSVFQSNWRRKGFDSEGWPIGNTIWRISFENEDGLAGTAPNTPNASGTDTYVDNMRLEHKTGNLGIRGQFSANQNFGTSDEKLKKDIESLDKHDSLNKLMSLNPVSFNWKNENKNTSSEKSLGLVAQEVEKILPQLVGEFDSFEVEDVNIESNVPVSMTDEQLESSEDIKNVPPTYVKYKSVSYDSLIPLLISTIQLQEQRIKDLESKMN